MDDFFCSDILLCQTIYFIENKQFNFMTVCLQLLRFMGKIAYLVGNQV